MINKTDTVPMFWGGLSKKLCQRFWLFILHSYWTRSCDTYNSHRTWLVAKKRPNNVNRFAEINYLRFFFLKEKKIKYLRFKRKLHKQCAAFWLCWHLKVWENESLQDCTWFSFLLVFLFLKEKNSSSSLYTLIWAISHKAYLPKIWSTPKSHTISCICGRAREIEFYKYGQISQHYTYELIIFSLM